jgi:hypothetical protein
MRTLLPISIAPTTANIETAIQRGPAAPFVQPRRASPTRPSFTARDLVDIEAMVVGEYVIPSLPIHSGVAAWRARLLVPVLLLSVLEYDQRPYMAPQMGTY